MTCGPFAFYSERHSVLCLCSLLMCVCYNLIVGLEFASKWLPFLGFPCRNGKQLDESRPHVGCCFERFARLVYLTWHSNPEGTQWTFLARAVADGSTVWPRESLRHITAAIWQQRSTAHFVSQTVGSVA